MNSPQTPAGWANRINHLLDASASVGSARRFPVDVGFLAEHIPSQFQIDEPIVLQEASMGEGFDGCLAPFVPDSDSRQHWALIYNSDITSPGRIRFTQAHELGHYLLHRHAGEVFNCSDADMLDWNHPEKVRENEADTFASYLLMPRTHFERRIGGQTIDLNVLSDCAEFFGVSLLAATLKWLEFTSQRAVLVTSRNKQICWARGSENGKWLSIKLNKRLEGGRKARLPSLSVTANDSKDGVDRFGTELDARVWFPDEPQGTSAREMVIVSDQYRYAMTLLLLPDEVKPWQRNSPRQQTDEDGGLEDTLTRFERNGQPLQR